MKNLSVFILVIIIALSSFTIVKTGLGGHWASSTKTSEFSIDLKQNGKAITGTHTSVQQNGKRIDDGKGPKEDSLTGTVNDAGVATVTFTSGYGINNTGTATIKLIADGKLEWQIVTKPKQEYYIPDHAVLSPEKK